MDVKRTAKPMTAGAMHTRLSESVATTLFVMNGLATCSDVLPAHGARVKLITDLAKAMAALSDVAEALTVEPRKR